MLRKRITDNCSHTRTKLKQLVVGVALTVCDICEKVCQNVTLYSFGLLFMSLHTNLTSHLIFNEHDPRLNYKNALGLCGGVRR